MRQRSDRQTTDTVLRAQFELFERAATAAGLSDNERRAALLLEDRGLTEWRLFLTGGRRPRSATPEMLRCLAHASFQLVTAAEPVGMAA